MDSEVNRQNNTEKDFVDNSNIKVADYLTQLPEKQLFEQKLRTAIEIAKQRLEAISRIT